MSKKAKLSALILVGLFLVMLVALPISNFFLARDLLPVTDGIAEFKPVSLILQNKCADCHSPDMTVYPLYTKLPIASQLIAKDREEAQQNMLFNRERLSGKQPFSKLDLARIQNVVENNEMPPVQYKLMHWNAGLTKADKETIIEWLQAEAAQSKSSQ